jgi:acetamidase/formamidase
MSFDRLRSAILCAAFSLLAPLAHAQQPQTLLVSPSTVIWGHFWSEAKPALTVKSGDTVVMQTISTCGAPEHLKAIGVADADIPPYVANIFANMPPPEERGPGSHIKKIHLDVPWACNSDLKGGFLDADFPTPQARIIPLDRKKMTGAFSQKITIPLHPFFGDMGLAPSVEAGKISSGPPGAHAGNMDNKELVAGSTLFIPVRAKDGLFEAGDGHAGQGNGEVDVMALETQLTGTFQFIVHKKKEEESALLWPRAETPASYISMGFDQDLTKAAEISLHNMITFLSEQMTDHPRISREEAYALISVACDVDITELVDGNKGVHTMCAKSLFNRK